MTPDLPRLPREIEADPGCEAIRRALQAQTRRLWPAGAVVAPVVALTEALRAALASTSVLLARGLEAAESALDAERRGLAALPAAEAARHGTRVSRVLLVTDDGAERLYRRVERLVGVHAPRVLPIVLACDAGVLGELLYGGGTTVKLVLTQHKTAAATILRALA